MRRRATRTARRLDRLSDLAIDVFLWRSASSSSWSSWSGSALTLARSKYTLDDWADLVGRGLTLGSIYALIALGYTMVYGILRMINFAHGEIFMGGAFARLLRGRGHGPGRPALGQRGHLVAGHR